MFIFGLNKADLDFLRPQLSSTFIFGSFYSIKKNEVWPQSLEGGPIGTLFMVGQVGGGM